MSSPTAADPIDSTSSIAPSSSTDTTSLRKRGGAKHSTPTAAGGESSDPTAKPNIAHISQGSSGTSSAHICSNVESCPLIAAWNAAASPSERDSLPLSESVYACSNCFTTLYCSFECQRLDWLDHGHRAKCPAMRAAYMVRHPEQFTEDQRAIAAATASPPASIPSPAAPALRPSSTHNVRVNFDIRFGPRAIFIIALVLYLIYRSFYRSADSHSSGSGTDHTSTS